MMRIKNCILTGSNGYIGSHLKPYLENKQIKVIPYMGDINKFYISETPDMIFILQRLLVFVNQLIIQKIITG